MPNEPLERLSLEMNEARGALARADGIYAVGVAAGQSEGQHEVMRDLLSKICETSILRKITDKKTYVFQRNNYMALKEIVQIRPTSDRSRLRCPYEFRTRGSESC
jgi:hypothetical protein